jgi:hypothetical protein
LGRDFSGYRGLGLGIIFWANLELGKSSEKFYDLAFGTEISHHEYRVLKLSYGAYFHSCLTQTTTDADYNIVKVGKVLSCYVHGHPI